MSPAAGYPATGRSLVQLVGDACRLVKLKPRIPETISWNDLQGYPGRRWRRNPRRIVRRWGRSRWERWSAPQRRLGFRHHLPHRRDPHSNRPGQPQRSRVSGPKRTTPRGPSRYAPHIHVRPGVLQMNRDHFHPCPRADPVTDRRPEVNPADEPGANISEGVSEMGPDQFHQNPCTGATHRMNPAAGASRDPNPTHPGQSSEGHKT